MADPSRRSKVVWAFPADRGRHYGPVVAAHIEEMDCDIPCQPIEEIRDA